MGFSGRGHNQATVCGKEESLKKLFDIVQNRVAAGHLGITDTKTGVYRVTLPDPSYQHRRELLLDEYADPDKRYICAIVYEGTECKENYLIHLDLSPNSHLYTVATWLIRVARGGVTLSEIATIKNEFELEQKAQALIASLAQPESATPQHPDPATPKLPTPDEMYEFVSQISLALDPVLEKLRGTRMKKSAPRDDRESIIEMIDEIKNALYGMALELKLAIKEQKKRVLMDSTKF